MYIVAPRSTQYSFALLTMLLVLFAAMVPLSGCQKSQQTAKAAPRSILVKAGAYLGKRELNCATVKVYCGQDTKLPRSSFWPKMEDSRNGKRVPVAVVVIPKPNLSVRVNGTTINATRHLKTPDGVLDWDMGSESVEPLTGEHKGFEWIGFPIQCFVVE